MIPHGTKTPPCSCPDDHLWFCTYQSLKKCGRIVCLFNAPLLTPRGREGCSLPPYAPLRARLLPCPSCQGAAAEGGCGAARGLVLSRGALAALKSPWAAVAVAAAALVAGKLEEAVAAAAAAAVPAWVLYCKKRWSDRGKGHRGKVKATQ